MGDTDRQGEPVAAWALRTAQDAEAVSVHLPALREAGLLGIAEEDGRATIYVPDRVEGLPVEGEWVPVPQRDWLEEWKAGLEPLTVGALRIAPPWAAADGDIVIDVAQAFGTGHHETTAGCLAALQELDLDGRSVLDAGTGSGILAIAAARLGARTVVGVDTDPLAITEARQNARRNRVEVDLRVGSLQAAPGTFDVVVANLDTGTIASLAAGLRDRVAPGGTLVVSGVSTARVGEAVGALQRAGLSPVARPGRDWAVLVAGR